MKLEKIKLDLGENSYNIIIKRGLLTQAAKQIQSVTKSNKVIVISDQNVAKLYLDPLVKNLQNANFTVGQIIIDAGELQKSFVSLTRICNNILKLSPDRSTTLIALGGGVIGDLVGFAASIMLRGIDFIQIPTTLLAQVDSSVGGKTGINTNYGKNLIGSFYQPKLVLIDTDTLTSLSEREFNSGYAEAVKYGLINNSEFFEFLEANKSDIKARNLDVLQKIIKTSCQSKADIVKEDEKEQNDRRALLNLGHSFGHSLEHNINYSDDLKHGEAVAIGMILAFKFSESLKLCPEDTHKKIIDHFKYFGIPTDVSDINFSFDPNILFKSMFSDKKNQNGNLVLILASNIGEAYVARNINHHAIEQFLNLIYN
ncbi:MAG: 3-dehydroquinate synthase [Rickettsiales bacterium]|jgi:3-dehydroquinate synthase|nr:3-dehydroquinate synthase [Rickettsiales bacterium]